jgi:hypothetical protein
MRRKENSADLRIQHPQVCLPPLLGPSVVNGRLFLSCPLDLPEDGWIWSFRPTGNLTEQELEDWVAEGVLFFSVLRH